MNKKIIKNESAEVSPSLASTYTVARLDSGYSVFQLETVDGKQELVKITEPDMLVITMNKLAKIIKKDLGL